MRIPATTVSIELVRCPPGVNTRTGEPIPQLWVLKTEVPWELYDIFLYGLDRPEALRDLESAPDAIARPSKPYVPPDRGFGHTGYPAMGMTRAGAEGFCLWLSEAMGLQFRLPTEAEFIHLASAGTGEPLPPGVTFDNHDVFAWTSANADFTTHPVATKRPNPFGLHDMLGNVAEWVMTDGRRPVAMGGAYLDPPEDCAATASRRQDSSWNASDPQIPKSAWWLADCSWVGFRVVTEMNPGKPPTKTAPSQKTPSHKAKP